MLKVNKGIQTLSFSDRAVHKEEIRQRFYKRVEYTDPSGLKKYTYIPNDKGLNELGLKVNLMDAFRSAAVNIWKEKTKYLSTVMYTDRYFERVPIGYGTSAPKKFTGNREYKDLRFNAAEVVGVEYSDGYQWFLKDELELMVQQAIMNQVIGHVSDYASIHARQMSLMIQGTSHDDFYPEAVVSPFDDKALINNTSGRLMSAASEALCGTFSGNVLTGTMSTTPAIATLSADIDNVFKALALIEHPEDANVKFWDNPLEERYTIIFYVPPTLLLLFRDLLKSEYLPVTDKVTTNVYRENKFIVKTLPYLTGSATDLSYYVQIFDNQRPYITPGVEVRHNNFRNLTVDTWGWDTGNKEMSDKMSKAVGFYDFCGYGCGLPQCMIKVLNT